MPASGDVALWLGSDGCVDDRGNALWRDTPGPNYIHFPDWLGRFYDELTAKSAAVTENGETGRGANEAFDLLVYDALAVLHGYERSAGPPHRTGHSGKRGSSSRRSVLVKRYPRN
ncbi:phage terminase large subunit family protein [Escherichia coli]|nr:phage terminase large subunit family protein [Escherichia coli]